jgi:hypothetical protein
MTTKRSDLVPPLVRAAVRDAIGGWGPYTVNEVGELFIGHGFQPTTGEHDESRGQRANEAERFHAAIDWTDPDQTDRYLRVVEEVLDANNSDDLRDRYERLVKVLKRAGFERDERGRLRLPAPPPAATIDGSRLPTESDILLHLRRLERLDQEPKRRSGRRRNSLKPQRSTCSSLLASPSIRTLTLRDYLETL